MFEQLYMCVPREITDEEQNAFIALKKKNKDLRKNVQRLKGTLTKINNGFKHEYGHSDADRYCSSIKYWNEIIVKALRTS